MAGIAALSDTVGHPSVCAWSHLFATAVSSISSSLVVNLPMVVDIKIQHATSETPFLIYPNHFSNIMKSIFVMSTSCTPLIFHEQLVVGVEKSGSEVRCKRQSRCKSQQAILPHQNLATTSHCLRRSQGCYQIQLGDITTWRIPCRITTQTLNIFFRRSCSA